MKTDEEAAAEQEAVQPLEDGEADDKLDIEEVIERRDNLCIDDLAIAINRFLVHRMTARVRLEAEHFEHAFLGALDIVGDDADLNDVSQFVSKSKILNFHDAFPASVVGNPLGSVTLPKTILADCPTSLTVLLRKPDTFLMFLFTYGFVITVTF